jgi:hypothetical protein
MLERLRTVKETEDIAAERFSMLDNRRRGAEFGANGVSGLIHFELSIRPACWLGVADA